jgi:hypothetical protein
LGTPKNVLIGLKKKDFLTDQANIFLLIKNVKNYRILSRKMKVLTDTKKLFYLTGEKIVFFIVP